MPKIIFICGPNGAGKSTLARILSLEHNIISIDPDALASQGLSPIAAGKAAIKMARHFIELGVSFLRESTLAAKFDFSLMEEAKKAGYTIELIYICLDSPHLAQERVLARKARGGHNVPAADIIRRYHKSLSNLAKAIKIADKVVILNNSQRAYKMEPLGQIVARLDHKL